MVEVTIKILNPSGLHARPAARFVELASSFQSEILVRDLTTGSKPVNAKSILGILTLGVEYGHEIEIATLGEDEAPACEALSRLVGEELLEIDEAYPEQTRDDM